MKTNIRLAKAELRLLLAKDDIVRNIDKELQRNSNPITRERYERQKNELLERTKNTNKALRLLSKKRRAFIDLTFFNPPSYLTVSKISEELNIPIEKVNDYKNEVFANLYLLLKRCG